MNTPETRTMNIRAFRSNYSVNFRMGVEESAADVPRDKPFHCIVDKNVLRLHGGKLDHLLGDAACTIEFDAIEDNKSLERLSLIADLARADVKRDHLLVAVGGGIVQDMTCFAASILFRGMDWAFLPTTLLSQADSCIGSKSSINATNVKNLVGTFHAPRMVSLAAEFLRTLSPAEIHSGVGEMLKVHIIEGRDAFGRIETSFDALFSDPNVMLQFIRASLEIKKRLIEIDEFDRGPRNVMNYGHSFGHAIEKATDFAIPHGIAVTIGADMANFVATNSGRMSPRDYDRMHRLLKRNYASTNEIGIPLRPLFSALSKDKKNIGTKLTLILPDHDAKPALTQMPLDDAFKDYCARFISEQRVN